MLIRSEQKEENFDATHAKLKNDICVKLSEYEKIIETTIKDYKLEPLESKEIEAILYDNYRAITKQINEFSEMVIEIKLKEIEFENKLKEITEDITKNQKTKFVLFYRDGLNEAIKNTIQEFKETPSQIKTLLTQTSSATDSHQVTNIIDHIFSQLFSTFQKGSHPFAILLDKNLTKLCTSGKFNIGKEPVLKITGGTLSARKLSWNKEEQDKILEKWLQEEIHIHELYFRKKLETIFTSGVTILKTKRDKIIDAIEHAQTLLSKSEIDIIKILVQKARNDRDRFLKEAKEIYSSIQTIRNTTYDEKSGEPENIQKMIFELTQIVEQEVKFHLEKPITNLFFQTDLVIQDLENKLTKKQKRLFNDCQEALNEMFVTTARISKMNIDARNYHIQPFLSDSLIKMKEHQKSITALHALCEKLKTKLTDLLQKNFPPTLESLKKINKTVQIIREETALLRRKKEYNLFKSSASKKAKQIDKSVEFALQNLDVIFQAEEKDAKRIDYFFEFKDPKQCSIKESLNKSRIFYAKSHMFGRISGKVKTKVLVGEPLEKKL